MEEQPESSNIDNISESDKKLSSHSIPRHDNLQPFVQPASLRDERDYDRNRILAEYEESIKKIILKYETLKYEYDIIKTMESYPSSTTEPPLMETFNMQSDATEFERPISKFTFKPNSFSELSQEYIQEIKSDNKSKNYKKSMESSLAKSSPMEKLNTLKNRNKHFHKLYEKFEQWSKIRRKNDDLRKQVQIMNEILLGTRMERIPQEHILNNSIQNSETNEKSRNNKSKNYKKSFSINMESFLTDKAIKEMNEDFLKLYKKFETFSEITPNSDDLQKQAKAIEKTFPGAHIKEMSQRNKSENHEKSIESSSAESFFTELFYTQWNMISDDVQKIESLYTQKMSEYIKMYNNVIDDRKRNLQKLYSDRTIKINENDEGSKNNQNKERKNCQMRQKTEEKLSLKSAKVSVETKFYQEWIKKFRNEKSLKLY